MKKLYTVFLFLFLSVANAQEQPDQIDTTISCFDTKDLFKILKENYKESPIILGKVGDQIESTMSIWVHPIEKTWTIVATKDNLSCVIGTGSDFNIITRKRGKSI